MTAGWFVFGFFRELLFRSRSEKELLKKQIRNRNQVLSRIKNFSFYKHMNISKWEHVPIINKRDYLREFKNMNLENFELNQVADFSQKMEQTHDPKRKYNGYTVGLSTGTSGTRSAFILGNREIGLWAGSILARAFGWQLFRPQRIAFVFRTNGPLYEGVNRGWIRMRFFDINQTVDVIDSELKKWQPTVLISVPHFISRYIGRNTVAEISPCRVFSCADVLDAAEKKKIESYFKIPVREIYQATEGFLGISCSAGELHLNEDNYIIEKKKIDETRFYPVITDVERRSQAIIRYELDDILVEKEGPCHCGRPGIILERIEGRSDQVLSFSTSTTAEMISVYPDFLRGLLRDGSWYHWNYLITQTQRNALTIALDRDLASEESLKLKEHVQSALKTLGSIEVEIKITRSSEFPELRGKRRRIIGLAP